MPLATREKLTYPRIAIEDIDIVARIEVIDGTLTIDLKCIWNLRYISHVTN